MKKFSVVFTFTIICILFLSACFSPFMHNGKETTVTIQFGGSARSINGNIESWPPTDENGVLRKLEHKVILSNSEGIGQEERFAEGISSGTFRVTPGIWTIRIEADYDDLPFGRGAEINFNVIEGQNNHVQIEMKKTENIFFEVNSANDWGRVIGEINNLNPTTNPTTILHDNYVININDVHDIRIESPLTFGFGNTVVIRGNGTLSLSQGQPGSLFTINYSQNSIQTVIIKDINLVGFEGNGSPLVNINPSGIFYMQGYASISGNTAERGGGVNVSYGAVFNMQGGEIFGNTAVCYGGGVYVDSGTFNKTGGIIYGSDAAPEKQNIAGTTGTGSGNAVYAVDSMHSGAFSFIDKTIGINHNVWCGPKGPSNNDGYEFVGFDDINSSLGAFIVSGNLDGVLWNANARTLTINQGGDYTIRMGNDIPVTTTDRIVVAATGPGTATGPAASVRTAAGAGTGVANITLIDVNINGAGNGQAGNDGFCAFYIEPGARVNLTLAGNNFLKSGAGRAGLEVSDGAELEIAGDGSLTAEGSGTAADFLGIIKIRGGIIYSPNAGRMDNIYFGVYTPENAIVFNELPGTVYGDFILRQDLTLNYNLTIPAGASLTIASGVVLVNNSSIGNLGTITNEGMITNQGTIDNQGEIINNNGQIFGSVGGNGILNGSTDEPLSIPGAILDDDYTYDNNELRVLRSGTFTIRMGDGFPGSTNNRIVVDQGITANITLQGVNINVNAGYAFYIEDGATVNLTLVGNNNISSIGLWDNNPVLNISGNGELVLTNGIGGTGQITINGGNIITTGQHSPGISGSNITITGGNVTATGQHSPGISGSNITINGGNVTARGDSNSGAAGISSQNGVFINDGIVEAIGGGNGGAGIGGGLGGNGGTVEITGGNVTAIGNGGGAGIGGGATNQDQDGTPIGGNGGVVTITGGTVTATGSGGGYGIGVGADGLDHGTINIDDVNAVVFSSP
jgi:hypothetical protein